MAKIDIVGLARSGRLPYAWTRSTQALRILAQKPGDVPWSNPAIELIKRTDPKGTRSMKPEQRVPINLYVIRKTAHDALGRSIEASRAWRTEFRACSAMMAAGFSRTRLIREWYEEDR
jgi:hypothetical protein